jgi:hypothetical protein
MNFQGMGCRRFCRWVSLFVGVPLGNLGRGSIYRELWEIVEGGLWKWSISLYGSLLGESGGVQEDSEDGHLFLWRPCWEHWERAHMPWAYVWKKALEWVSLHIGVLLGELVRGVCPLGTLRDG